MDAILFQKHSLCYQHKAPNNKFDKNKLKITSLNNFNQKANQHKRLIYLHLLHGFLGNPEEWQEWIKLFFIHLEKNQSELLSQWVIITHPIPGHLKGHYFLPPMKNYIELFKKNVLSLSSGKHWIYGYSMGGRIALQIGLRLKSVQLILESSGFSMLKKEMAQKLKQKRKQQEIIWIQSIRKDFEIFLKKWYQQELFSTYHHYLKKKKLYKKVIEDKKKLQTSQIIQSLWLYSPTKSLSSERQVSDYLLKKKPIYIAGDRDKKYSHIAKKIKKEYHLPLLLVQGASHNPHKTHALTIIQFVQEKIERYISPP